MPLQPFLCPHTGQMVGMQNCPKVFDSHHGLGVQYAFNDWCNVGKTDTPLEKGGNRHLIGRVQHRRGAAARAAELTWEAKAAEIARVYERCVAPRADAQSTTASAHG